MNKRRSTSQRQSTIKQNRREQARKAQRNRMLIIGGVILAAVVVVGALIALGSRPQPAGDFTTVPTQTWPQANGKSMGPADAKVVLTEYADFQCPVCKQFHEQVFQKIVDQYVKTGKVRYEYKHFIVIDGNVGGTKSRHSAEASECAADQNKFWDYFSILFANQGAEGSEALSDTRLRAFAQSIGLDMDKFNSCFNSGQDSQRVEEDNRSAVNLKLQGTPTLLVNGQVIENWGDYTALVTTIEAAINKAGQ